MRASVIVSTYNNPQALEKTLWGLCCQTCGEFEVVIADDGSAGETETLIERYRREVPFPLTRVWHEDRGFRKGEILNQAIVAAAADYLIFTDGDCIPRDDFVATHVRLARPGYFITGGSHVNIPAAVHAAFTRDDVAEQRVFDCRWLAARGVRGLRYRLRLTRRRVWAAVLDLLTPRWGAFVGNNSSAWKHDLVAVNGFSGLAWYGADDKELGVRLTNHGVRSRRHKHALVCLHLKHPIGAYDSPERRRQTKRHLRELRARRITWTPHGIRPS